VARPLRLLVADGLYHVTTRGIARNAIFTGAGDRRLFIHVLEQAISRFDWRCLSYCLMENHFHLLLRTPEANLSRGMRHLNGGYAQAFNRRYERIGPLFSGRYGAKLIQQDRHVLEVFRYLALNPVTAGLCAAPSAWAWGAHGALAGERQASSWLAVDEARSWFTGPGSVDGIRAYRDFVESPSVLHAPTEGVVLGDAEFRREVLPDVRPDSEFPERDWGDGRPSLDELLGDGGTGASIAVAYRKHGYTMASIADAVGCHVCTVSRRLHAYEGGMRECKT
jgi:putative transposase